MSKIKPKAKPQRRRVVFSFRAPEADIVALVGSFNDWDPHRHPMDNKGHGLWKKSVTLPPGEYEYKFWIDGQWREDPRNHRTLPNAFGTTNNIVTVSTE
ncbi:MAG: glycogen-binding domain-containing protein [Deltaproteobacteria bacterium]|mgnify:CR=1 FL=1|nr:glycogen-binding domain-containing protein [Deltaproteobacteria bacterium]